MELDYEDLELTDEMIERNDEIDNAVYQCILALTEKTEDELDWNMQIIGEVTDAIKDVLWHDFKLKVRHPAVVTDGDEQYYSEYDYDGDNGEIMTVYINILE